MMLNNMTYEKNKGNLSENSIENNIELFSNQIQDYFNNLLENGREVKLQIKVFKDWGKNLRPER